MSPTWVPPSFQRIALAVLLPLLASVCLGMEAQHQHPSDLRFHLRLLVPPILGLVLGIAVLLFGLVFSL